MKRTRPTVLTLMAMLLLFAVVAPSAMGAGYLSASNRGWYDNTGEQSTDNYCVGTGCGAPAERDYMVFDMSSYSSATDGVSAAAVIIANPFGGGGVPRTLELHRVTTPIDQLTTPHTASPESAAIWQDLGDGTLFGSATPATIATTPVSVQLNGEGLLTLTKAMGVGKVAMGGMLTNTTIYDFLFGSSGGGPDTNIQLQFQLGPKTTTTLAGPNRVPQGRRAKFTGMVSSASIACYDEVEIQVTVGSRHFTVVSTADGSYSFKARIKKTTKVRAFYPGTLEFSPPNPCAGSDATKTVSVS